MEPFNTSMAIHNPTNIKAQEFIRKLNITINMIKNSGAIFKKLFKVYFLLFNIVFGYNVIRKKFKEAIKDCSGQCSDPDKCSEFFCNTAIEIRDNLLTLFDLSKDTNILIPFRYTLEKAATDWDDFAEDCIIASDPDINKMLDKIADAA